MILVDTHAVIWMTQGGTLLSQEAEHALIRGRTEGRLAIADITLREVADLIAKKRVTVKTSMAVYLRFVESLFHIVPISGAIAERSIAFGSRYPKDPADRLIGATAVVHGWQLVTKDERIRASGEVACIW